jgi:hypothetical protein
LILNSGDPRPLLLVDVDGVLNPWRAFEIPAGFREYSFFPGDRVLLSEGHGALLRELAGSFELVWATAWEHRANRLICPVIGLPELPVIEFPLGGRDFFFRKLPAVIESVGDRPCAWIDDEHRPDHDDWARDRGVPTLIVDIDPAVGLTARVAADLAEWAANLRDQPSSPD